MTTLVSPAARGIATSAPPGPWMALVPFVFVIIWSTGFIVAKFGLPYAPPLTFLMVRFAVALMVLLPMVALAKVSWPKGQALHIAVAGVLVQAGYLGGVWAAIKLGMPAGLAALIVGMQPILTAFAAPLLGESVRGRQWLGLLFGIAGVALVVSNKINLLGLSAGSIALDVLALVSITIGTMYQKRFCPRFDLRVGTAIQYAASFLALLPFAVIYEGLDWHFSSVHWTLHFVIALLWAAFALSIGAIFLLFILIRRNATTSVTSLLYLTPPTTALMAWAMFGEAFSLTAMIGMLLAVVGVAFVVRRA